MDHPVLLIVYSILILMASLGGGGLSRWVRMTHLRTQLLMSAVGGLMLGIAMMHLLPEAIQTIGSPRQIGAAVLAGLVSMFLLIRLFHTHDHGAVEGETHDEYGDGQSHLEPRPQCDHEHPGPCHTHDHHGRSMGWAGLFFGMALHTIIDGVALSASVLAEDPHVSWLGLAGLGTFLAIVLHKPLDAFAITSVMQKQGWSTGAQKRASVAFSACCPLGAAGFYLGAQSIPNPTLFVGWGLAVAAGFFICIALADLLPEVAFHDHDRGKLTFALLVGIGVAIAIENLPGHSHEHGHGHNASRSHDVSEVPLD